MWVTCVAWGGGSNWSFTASAIQTSPFGAMPTPCSPPFLPAVGKSPSLALANGRCRMYGGSSPGAPKRNQNATRAGAILRKPSPDAENIKPYPDCSRFKCANSVIVSGLQIESSESVGFETSFEHSAVESGGTRHGGP